MTTTAPPALIHQFPPVPDVPYVIGIWGGDGLTMHAVAQVDASEAVARTDAGNPGRAHAECGRNVILARSWGGFERGNKHVDRKTHQLCPYCAWTVALATGQVDDELAALDPGEADIPVLRRRLGDPGIVRRVCERILAKAHEVGYLDEEEGDIHHPHIVEQLAHVTAHRPHVLMDYECADGCCDHGDDTARDGARCKADFDIVACETCSLLTGEHAGEWAGTYEVVVSSPCSALTAIAKRYDVAGIEQVAR